MSDRELVDQPDAQFVAGCHLDLGLGTVSLYAHVCTFRLPTSMVDGPRAPFASCDHGVLVGADSVAATAAKFGPTAEDAPPRCWKPTIPPPAATTPAAVPI